MELSFSPSLPKTKLDYVVNTTYMSTTVFKNTKNIDIPCVQQLKIVS